LFVYIKSHVQAADYQERLYKLNLLQTKALNEIQHRQAEKRKDGAVVFFGKTKEWQLPVITEG